MFRRCFAVGGLYPAREDILLRPQQREQGAQRQRRFGAIQIFPPRERHGQHDALGAYGLLQRRVLRAEGAQSPGLHGIAVRGERACEQRHAAVAAENGDRFFHTLPPFHCSYSMRAAGEN